MDLVSIMVVVEAKVAIRKGFQEVSLVGGFR